VPQCRQVSFKHEALGINLSIKPITYRRPA
jgi:hypothetical protein